MANDSMELQYLDLVGRILREGDERMDRTGTGTFGLFGAQLRCSLRDDFPLLTTKKVAFGPVVRELIWFLRGSTNINDDLTQHTKIWDAWADERGELGPVYGYQWRSWGMGTPGAGDGIDQISRVVADIKANPWSRRHIVSAWNVTDLPKMALAPCHVMFQFNVRPGRRRPDGDPLLNGHPVYLDLQLYQRSADMMLGVPFNIASYALLLRMVASECRLIAGDFVYTLGDAHVYKNHVDGAREQISRRPKDPPRVRIADKPVLEQRFEDVELYGYDHHPAIKFDVSV
jgi:thymidylate synthase